MQANPDYWGQPQKPRPWIFSISREPNVRVQKLMAGECQVTSADPRRGRGLDRRPPRHHRRQDAGAEHLLPVLQHAQGRRRDRRDVREALDIAIDRNAIFKALFPRGDAMQAVSAFPPAIPGYDAG